MLVAWEHETEREYGITFRNRGDYLWALTVLEGRWAGYEPGPLFVIAWERLAELLPCLRGERRVLAGPCLEERRA